MNRRPVPRFMVSAAHKSSGKTTVSLGLSAAFAARGMVLQTFKKGPDYIDPMWLALASGRPCFNLDAYLMGDDAVRESFLSRASSTGLNLVEGNKGLYDGLSLDGSNSNAALARSLGLTVVLVIDARGMTRGIAPLILGYQAFERDIRIGGVILNRLGGSRHEAKLRAVIEHYTDVPVLGAIQNDERLAMNERHLGLVPTAEFGDPVRFVRGVADAIASQVDLNRMEALARSAEAFSGEDDVVMSGSPAAGGAMGGGVSVRPREIELIPSSQRGNPLRIGIARDRAFCFYYADDLAALEDAGAELITIDTLADTRLPQLDGLFIGGGFPEVHMDALEANASLRHELRHAIEGGLPVYAECGGLMYLSRSLHWKGRVARMVGAIPGDAVMHERPVGRGYVHLQETAAFPWLGRGAQSPGPRAHEFHYSSLENIDPGVQFGYRVARGHGIDGRHDGLVWGSVFASYAHRHSAGADGWVPRFVAHVGRVAAARRQRPLPPQFPPPCAAHSATTVLSGSTAALRQPQPVSP